METKEVLALWKKISAIVADEISSNKDFADKIGTLLAQDKPDAPKRRNRRDPGKINPFEIFQQGDNALYEALASLSIDELKDIIAENGMDTAKLAMKWKDRDRLKKHIVEATQRRSTKGEAFAKVSGKSLDNE